MDSPSDHKESESCWKCGKKAPTTYYSRIGWLCTDCTSKWQRCSHCFRKVHSAIMHPYIGWVCSKCIANPLLESYYSNMSEEEKEVKMKKLVEEMVKNQ